MAQAQVSQLQTQQKEKGLVKYVAADGQEVTLTPEIVKKYLVQGKGELVTMQELMYFLNICRARRLNPLTKDCYLIKYSENESAAIVTSIDYFRKRARAQKDCKGWQKGVIVQDEKTKALRYSNGLVLSGEKLVGGWFEATPEGWTTPFKLEVNLGGFIKKTKDGRITKFWSEENQPSQIMKVAESQGLRTLWPDEFQQINSDAEAAEVDMKDMAGTIDVTATPDDAAFKAIIPEGTDPVIMAKYLEVCAAHFRKPVDEIKAGAVEDPKGFFSAFDTWKAQQDKKAQVNGKKAEPEKSQAGMTGKAEDPQELCPEPCPNKPDLQYIREFCAGTCKEYDGCPAWKK
jgi:phage recombination protein Bet